MVSAEAYALGNVCPNNLTSRVGIEEVPMNRNGSRIITKSLSLITSILGAILIVTILIIAAHHTAQRIQAAPIDPPEGYPKLSQSVKIVTPTLAHTGGATLHYRIEIRNTGAYTAEGVTLTDKLPVATTYNNDAWASSPPTPTFNDGTLAWMGEVGFDQTVIVSFSVTVSNTFSGVIQNSAVISAPLVAEPVTVTAETMISDAPIFQIEKTSTPMKPGANELLTYFLSVTNHGQPATNTPITVTDQVPIHTVFSTVGSDGAVEGDLVTWNRQVNLDTGASSTFTFTVTVDDVISGTVVTNDTYAVVGPDGIPNPGELYTVTIIDPILYISKYIQPDPPGSNREATYYLTVLNKGSHASNLTISDFLPDGVTYVTGGTFEDGIVSWDLPSLDTNQAEVVTFTVFISDVADVPILNADYEVCSEEEVCGVGLVLTSTVGGPTFRVGGSIDPIAKKPGGGTSPVTPTLTVKNLGPGNALDATANLIFERISVQASDLIAIPPVGVFYPGTICDDLDKCVDYQWVGDIGYGETITFTTLEGQNSQGGEEGTHYTATLVITDSLGAYVTPPVSATITGTVTHMANLIPTKTAPAIIGNGQILTYTINVFNSGLTTDVPPYPWLTDTVPLSTTLVSISNGGVSTTVDSQTVITWTLPSMGPGDLFQRTFSVLVDQDLVSGTQIINWDYGTAWFNIVPGGVLSNTGVPVTTTVKEVGLIDSFKTVTPTLVRPGPENTLTFTVYVVNSSPIPLSEVHVWDVLPWQNSTYQRDGIASAGQIISDIVSLDWVGNVGPYSTEVITFSVLVDANYSGAITNTAIISHTDLREPVPVQAVAYITDKPVLQITKTASPNPVPVDSELLYTIKVVNLGQQATNLVITDTIPFNTEYVPGSASSGGQLIGDTVQWQIPVLEPGDQFSFSFTVHVVGGKYIVNDHYRVSSAEKVSADGKAVVTIVFYDYHEVFLPIVRK